MKTYPTQFRWTHQYGFRSGEWSLITGVVMVDPNNGNPVRPCYSVVYSDGVTDLVPITDSENYELRPLKA